jgi:outer membrane protein assembly factor BamA
VRVLLRPFGIRLRQLEVDVLFLEHRIELDFKKIIELLAFFFRNVSFLEVIAFRHKLAHEFMPQKADFFTGVQDVRNNLFNKKDVFQCDFEAISGEKFLQTSIELDCQVFTESDVGLFFQGYAEDAGIDVVQKVSVAVTVVVEGFRNDCCGGTVDSGLYQDGFAEFIL